MRPFKVKRLRQAPRIVQDLLDAVGSADPSIDIEITAAISKDLERSGKSQWDPGAEIDLPVEGVDVQLGIEADLFREFARNGAGLIFVKISRPAQIGTVVA